MAFFDAYKNFYSSALNTAKNYLNTAYVQPITRAVSSVRNVSQPQAQAAPQTYSPPSYAQTTAQPSGFGNLMNQQQPIPSSGGGGGAPGGQVNINPILEETPQFQQPQFDIGPGLQALDQAESALRSSLEANLSGLTESQTAGVNQERAGITSAEEAAELQRQQKGSEFQSASAATRRQTSELMQGIQSRFGGSTSAGGAFSEILGSQASRNLAQFRNTYNQVLGQIDFSLNQSRNSALERIRQINSETSNLKQQARAAFQSAMADIGSRRAGLHERRGEIVEMAMQNYQNLVQDINARNANELRRVQELQLSYENRLAGARQSAQERAMAIQEEVMARQFNQAVNLSELGYQIQPQTFANLTGVPVGQRIVQTDGSPDDLDQWEAQLANMGLNTSGEFALPQTPTTQ